VSKIHHHPWTDAPAHKPWPALKGATCAIYTHSARVQGKTGSGAHPSSAL